MQLRIGEILAEQDVLTKHEVQQILAIQSHTGKPFGLIAEEQYGVEPKKVEQAWVRQYAAQARVIEPAFESFDPCALQLISRRQAWQFRILPIRFDGPELMVATVPEHLSRVLRFATNVIGVPVFIVMTTPESLSEALHRHYHLPGMNAGVEDDNMFLRLIRRSGEAS